MRRRVAGLAAGLVCLVSPVRGVDGVRSTAIVHEIEGLPHAQFGEQLAELGDVDGDGRPDFAASAPQFQFPPFFWGYVLVVSGATGETIRGWLGTEPTVRIPLAGLGDIDGDGARELAIVRRSAIEVVNPRTGASLYRARHPAVNPDCGIHTVLRTDDLDGDGIEDFVAASPCPLSMRDSGHGVVWLASGATGEPLWVVFGRRARGDFAEKVVYAGDADGDGDPDLVVSQPFLFVQEPLGGRPSHPPRLWVLDARTGETVDIYTGDPALVGFGYHGLAAMGDLDGNGKVEVLVSASATDHGVLEDTGWVGIFELPEFTLRYSFFGGSGRTGSRAGDRIGWLAAAAGDIDKDGAADFLASTDRRVTLGFASYGRLYLRSGRTGALLQVYDALQTRPPYFFTLSPLGDVDGDGIPEFLAGLQGRTFEDAQRRGAVQVLRFEPERTPFLRGDADHDGRVSVADAVEVVRILLARDAEQPCLAAIDTNNSDRVSLADAIYILYWLFRPGQPAPEAPFPDCGRFTRLNDREGLPCDWHGACRRDSTPDR